MNPSIQRTALLVTFSSILGLASTFASAGTVIEECLEAEGHWPYGPAHAVHTAGNRTYLASGAAVLIFDSTNPSSPSILGSVEFPDPVWELTVAGDLLLVADRWDSIRIADISDPANASEIGVYDLGASPTAYDVAVDGNFAYVAVRGYGLHVLDITDPTSPQKVGQLAYPGVDFIFDIEVSGAYVYMAADTLGLLVANISTPTNPQPAGSYPAVTDAIDLEIIGSMVYMASGSEGFHMIDVSNPMSPGAAGTVTYFGFSANVAVAGGYAVVATQVGGLRVIDVDGPGTPVEVSLLDEQVFDVAAAGGGYVYASNFSTVRPSELLLVDVSNPLVPGQTGTITTHSYSKGVEVAGNNAYVANGRAGLVILGLDDPANPVRHSTLATPGDAQDVGVIGNHVYVADWGSGVRVVDVTNPTLPVEVGNVPMPGIITWDLTVENDRIYVANGNDGVRILNATTPSTPFEEGSWDLPGAFVSHVDVFGTAAAAVGASTGWLIDVSDPTNPGSAVTFTLPATVEDVALDGTHIYVADGTQGLRIIDRTTLLEVGLYKPWPITVEGVVVDGDRAYLASGAFYGVIVLDISDRTDPTLVADYNTSGEAVDVALFGDRVVVADMEAGAVVVGACSAIFSDDFEGGTTGLWSAVSP